DDSAVSKSPPRAFISYSWDSEEHRAWVKDLARRLRTQGIDTILDQWHAVPGDQLPEFMERSIRENDFVIIICTPKYKLKSDQRSGGVGYEGDVMTAEVLTRGNHRKFIPVCRIGTWIEAAPSWIAGKVYVDLRGNPYSEEQYSILALTLLGRRPIVPEVGQEQVVAQASVELGSKRRRFDIIRDSDASH